MGGAVASRATGLWSSFGRDIRSAAGIARPLTFTVQFVGRRSPFSARR
jgi:hypothetical protein